MEDISKAQALEFIKSTLKSESLPTMVVHQINKFYKAGITYRQVARSVVYWFDVKKQDLSLVETYGIGIVPSIYEEADRYFEKKHQETEEAQARALKIKEQQENIIVRPVNRTMERKDKGKVIYDLNEYSGSEDS